MLKALWLTVRNHNTNLFCFSNFYDIEMSTGSTSQTFFGLSSDHNMTYIIVGAVVLGFLIIIFIIFIVITVILLRLYFNSIIYSEIMVLMSNFPPRFYCFPNFLPQRWSSGWEREGEKSGKDLNRQKHRVVKGLTVRGPNITIMTISMLHRVKKPRGEIDSENFLKLNCKYKFFNVVM